MSYDSKVVDLMQEKLNRDHEAGHEAYENGEAFKFQIFEFDDNEECPNGPGVIEGDHPVCVLMDDNAGFCMTIETAKRLVEELNGAIKSAEEEE